MAFFSSVLVITYNVVDKCRGKIGKIQPKTYNLKFFFIRGGGTVHMAYAYTVSFFVSSVVVAISGLGRISTVSLRILVVDGRHLLCPLQLGHDQQHLPTNRLDSIGLLLNNRYQ